MLKLISHVHTTYSTDGYHNPESILTYAKKRDFFVELLAHNSLLWTRIYPEVYKSQQIMTGIELGFKDTDIVAVGENLDELVRYFPVFNRRVERMLDVSLAEGLDILKKIGVGYTYAPHSTFLGGAAKNGYKSLLSRVDAIEVWNGSISFLPSYNKKALMLAEKLGKTKIAGVDGHIGLASLGSCYNEVETTSKEEIYEAVRKGKVEPHVKPQHPILLAKDYALLTFLAIKDILNSKLKISVNDITSLTKQLY